MPVRPPKVHMPPQKALRAFETWDMRPRYPDHNRLNVPALVIVGGHEPQKTIELSYEWHQQLTGSEFAILQDAYHGASPAQDGAVGDERAAVVVAAASLAQARLTRYASVADRP